MLTSNEKNLILESSTGTRKISINKLKNGKYQVDSAFFGPDGYYVAHKSTTRICENIAELTK